MSSPLAIQTLPFGVLAESKESTQPVTDLAANDPFIQPDPSDPAPALAVPDPKSKAIRLVKTQDLSRDEWLEVRKQGIGSSDAATAVGLNPYQSALELWMVKTGRDANLPKVDPNDDTSPMYWGTLLEHIVAAHYTRRTGNRVRRVNAVLQHPQHPWMLANIDREVTGSSEVQILECKTAGINGAKLWKNGVPDYVQLQVMHQLAVTGKDVADVAVLIGGQDLQIHRIYRDEALIEQLIGLEAQFWECVEKDIEPKADGSESAQTALRALYPGDSFESVIDLKGDLEMNAAFSDLLSLRQHLTQTEKYESEIRQRIQQRMGDCSKALFDEGQISFKRSKDSEVFDTDKLKTQQPDLYQQFLKTREGSRRFVIQSK